MSKALMCDRCHGFFNPEEEKGRFLRIDNLVWATGASYKIQRYDVMEFKWDFCPACTKDFAVFMDLAEDHKETGLHSNKQAEEKLI